jgi:hypothetical protein
MARHFLNHALTLETEWLVTVITPETDVKQVVVVRGESSISRVTNLDIELLSEPTFDLSRARVMCTPRLVHQN